MTTTTTGRIDITGQRNASCQDVAVSRSMPAVLTGRMNQFTWASFCDEIDETLAPLNKAKKRLMICVPVCMLCVFGTFIFAFASMATRFDSYDPYGSSSSSSGFTMFMPFIIVFGVMFVLMPITMCWASRASSQGMEDMTKVCQDESAKHSGISFHLRNEQHLHNQGSNLRVANLSYIEVCVSNYTEPVSLPYDQGNVAGLSKPPIVSAFPVASSVTPAFNPDAVAFAQPEIDVEAGKKSPAERLRELDGMKGLLSEEEYQRKRAEILSAV